MAFKVLIMESQFSSFTMQLRPIMMKRAKNAKGLRTRNYFSILSFPSPRLFKQCQCLDEKLNCIDVHSGAYIRVFHIIHKSKTNIHNRRILVTWICEQVPKVKTWTACWKVVLLVWIKHWQREKCQVFCTITKHVIQQTCAIDGQHWCRNKHVPEASDNIYRIISLEKTHTSVRQLKRRPVRFGQLAHGAEKRASRFFLVSSKCVRAFKLSLSL